MIRENDVHKDIRRLSRLKREYPDERLTRMLAQARLRLAGTYFLENQPGKALEEYEKARILPPTTAIAMPADTGLWPKISPKR